MRYVEQDTERPLPEDTLFAEELEKRAAHAQDRLSMAQVDAMKWSRILTMCRAALKADPTRDHEDEPVDAPGEDGPSESREQAW